MFHIILFEPEIPPNTGNIIRLCANSGATLHLVHPLGFSLEESRLRRAGLDYREFATILEHPSLEHALTGVDRSRTFAFTKRASRCFSTVSYRRGDALLFGPETRGLGPAQLAAVDPAHLLRIPMRPGSRSLNLSNAVAIACYEAWRQTGFDGGV